MPVIGTWENPAQAVALLGEHLDTGRVRGIVLSVLLAPEGKPDAPEAVLQQQICGVVSDCEMAMLGAMLTRWALE